VLEGMGRDEVRLALGLVIQARGGPLEGPAVDILQILEGAPGQEVDLNDHKSDCVTGLPTGAHTPFHSRLDHDIG